MKSIDGTPTRKRRKPRRLLRRAMISLGVLTLVIAIGGGAIFWKLNANIDSAALPSHSDEDTTPKGAMNILFLGSDSRDLKSSDYGKADGTHRSDSMMLVHFAADNSRIDAVQIPRDTLMDLPACEDTGSGAFGGGNGMINSALQWGPACSVRAVEELSGVRVQHFVELDFDGFASMVNALGGVSVCLNEPMRDPDAKLDLPAGKQTLHGKDTLALARTRHAVGDGSDIGRLGHQQVVMSSIISRARSAQVLTRPDRLLKFLNAVTSSITVDEGISSIMGLTKLAKRAQSVPDSAITFITMPNGAAPSDPNRVVKTADADTIFHALATDQRVPVKGKDGADDADRTAPVRILNAALSTGLATRAQAALTQLGYTVSQTADAQKPAATTRLFIDSTPGARATAESINKDFGFKAEIIEQKQGMTGVWLILGSDRIEAGTDPVKPKPVKATTRKANDSLCA